MSNCQTGCLVFSLIHRELEIWSADRKEGEKKKIGRRKNCWNPTNFEENPTNFEEKSNQSTRSFHFDFLPQWQQHSLRSTSVSKNYNIFSGWFFCCFIPHITRIYLKRQLSSFSFWKFSVSAAFKRTGYNRPC